MTPYATGASIKDLVNESSDQPRPRRQGRCDPGGILRAKQLKSLGTPEDVDYIERERHAIAVHEACHAPMSPRSARYVH